MDAAAKADQLKLEELRIKTQQETDGAKLGVQIAKTREEGAAKFEVEGVRLGLEISKAAKEARKPSKKENK